MASMFSQLRLIPGAPDTNCGSGEAGPKISLSFGTVAKQGMNGSYPLLPQTELSRGQNIRGPFVPVGPGLQAV